MGRNTQFSQSHFPQFSGGSRTFPTVPFTNTSSPPSPTEKWGCLPLTDAHRHGGWGGCEADPPPSSTPGVEVPGGCGPPPPPNFRTGGVGCGGDRGRGATGACLGVAGAPSWADARGERGRRGLPMPRAGHRRQHGTAGVEGPGLRRWGRGLTERRMRPPRPVGRGACGASQSGRPAGPKPPTRGGECPGGLQEVPRPRHRDPGAAIAGISEGRRRARRGVCRCVSVGV